MARKLLGWFLLGGMVLFLAVMAAGSVIKINCSGRIAPGVWLFGEDFSGMSRAEAEAAVAEAEGVPEVRLELSCPILPEMRAEAEEKIRQAGYDTRNDISVRINGNEWCLTAKVPMIKVLTEETMERLVACSEEVTMWEWLYAAVFKRPLYIRQSEAAFAWEEERFLELLSVCAELLGRERQEAAVEWNDGTILVRESRTGFRIDTGKIKEEAEGVFTQVLEKIECTPVKGVVVRISLGGTAVMPGLSTAKAKKCDTKIAEFTTWYQGAGSGRAQNIAAGASHLNQCVILPQEEFSTAEALMPFTEGNGYTAGGTYVNGALSESIGGGVCQLSTTLYNALLRTKLTITERYAHSMPVGYIPPGQDAAIAGDYKDLKFKNTTDAPVLLLCKATGEEVKVTLYGTAEAVRPDVKMESVIVEENENGMTVEVYRLEQTEEGLLSRELVSLNKYLYLKKENR